MIETWRCADCFWITKESDEAVAHAFEHNHRVQGLREDHDDPDRTG